MQVIFVHGLHEQTPCPFFLTPHFAIAFKGLFSRESFVYVPYNKPDKLVSDIQAYNVHIAFPLNGALAKLRALKSAAFKKVRSRQTLRHPSFIIFLFMNRNLRARARACISRARANLRAHANPNSPQAFSDHQRFHRSPMAPLQVLRIRRSHI